MPAFGFALRGVSVRYGRTAAAERVTLDLQPGEAVAIVGPSGAGKTTLLRLMNGSVRPTAGHVLVDGRALASMTSGELQRVRAAVGFIHQDLRLVPTLRVVQNVVAGRLGSESLLRSLRHVFFTPRAVAAEAHAILDRVGIPEKLYERTDRLSGGQRQRVAIARALFQRPLAMLADEPVSSVDPTRARDAVQLLTTVSREYGLTLCVSLHTLELAREFFPRLVGMRQGRVMFDAPAASLTPAQFESLYHLEASEMLDGNG